MTTSAAYCVYTYDADNDIHLYKFHDNSRKAIDYWLQLMDELYQQRKDDPDKHVRIIIRTGTFTLPIRYTLQSLRQWQADRPDRAPTSVAILYENNPMLTITKAVVNSLPMMETLHFFQEENEDDAKRWLLQQ